MSGSETHTPDFSILLSRLAASGQWDRVSQYAQEWLAADPQNPRAHMAAGQSAVNLKRYPEARRHLEKVLEADPNNDFAYRLLSIVQFHAGEHAAADESIRKAISIDPNDAFDWYHLGWMCYRQRALPAARQCLERARELAPNDSNIINLLALCEPESPEAGARKFEQYQRALELDPENADVHNNLGVYYLNTERNFTAAEECFRRSLALNPGSILARQNLFLSLKKRDPVFRILHAPRDLLMRGIGLVGKSRRRNLWVFFCVLPIWLLTARFVICALALWFLFIWPLVKVYEGLTLGDIRAKVGEMGARQGGFLGHHRWPLKLRIGLFAGFLAGFWGGTAFCVWRWPEAMGVGLGLTVGAVMVYLLVHSLRNMVKDGRRDAHGKKRSRVVNDLLAPGSTKRSWWHFFRKKPISHE